MESQSLILGIIIAILSALIVLWPFITASRDEESAESRMEQLVAQRDAIYATIRDLDFDFETGKLTEADYRAEREAWVERGVEVLKAIDALQEETGVSIPAGPAPEETPPPDGSERADLDFDAQIEAAIASRRRTA